MVIIVAAATVGGIPGVAASPQGAGQAPAPVEGVASNAYERVIANNPGTLLTALQAAPNSMTEVLQQNPRLMDPVAGRLPDVLAPNGTIMAQLPFAMFTDAATMTALESSRAFVSAMLQNDEFMRALNSNPAVTNQVAQMQAESTAAQPQY